jgi:hypothetical protein
MGPAIQGGQGWRVGRRGGARWVPPGQAATFEGAALERLARARIPRRRTEPAKPSALTLDASNGLSGHLKMVYARQLGPAREWTGPDARVHKYLFAFQDRDQLW